MTTVKVPITKQGFEKLSQELFHLISEERPKVIKAIEIARSHGDLSENAEYDAAKDKQGFIEGQIQGLESKLANSEVVDETIFSGDNIKFGATVTLHDEINNQEVIYKLVGEYEADIDNNLLSVKARLGRALINKKVGDLIEFNTPKGKKVYSVIKVEFK